MSIDSNLESQIKADITDNKVFLYMKGTPQEPMCGFSAQVIQILNYYEVEYGSKNVLADESLRQGIKEFSDWPTIPQLYIKGEFVGGCDIISEMAQNGELEKLLVTAK